MVKMTSAISMSCPYSCAMFFGNVEQT